MPDRDTFFFIINFVREQGDPRRIFDAASRLIDGFTELDETVGRSIDAKLKTTVVLQDIQSGSLRVCAGRPARSRGCKSLTMKVSEPHRPRVMRRHPRGCLRSVDRGARRPSY